MNRSHTHDSHIIYVDPQGVRHAAIVTSWWGAEGAGSKGEGTYGSKPPDPYQGAAGDPGCNLVYVSGDTAKTDPYGRQLERATSVVHKSKQPAHGNYWCWPDE